MGSGTGIPTISSLVSGELQFFIELHVENCVIRCFKCFSNVLLRLKPRAFDFSTSSLSKYNTTFPLFPIVFASARAQMEVLCFKSGLLAGTLIS